MAEKEKLKPGARPPNPELLKRIRVLQNLEMLEMMKELKLLKKKKASAFKGERK